MKTQYEGEPVRDGTYALGQLSKSGYGRVLIPGSDLLYNDMPVVMDDTTFAELFRYLKTRDQSINDFNAVVVDCKIVHVY